MKVKDGWHRIAGYDVIVEDNCVIRGAITTRNAWGYTDISVVYPYRIGKNGGFSNCTGITFAGFKSGVYRGTICML